MEIERPYIADGPQGSLRFQMTIHGPPIPLRRPRVARLRCTRPGGRTGTGRGTGRGGAGRPLLIFNTQNSELDTFRRSVRRGVETVRQLAFPYRVPSRVFYARAQAVG